MTEVISPPFERSVGTINEITILSIYQVKSSLVILLKFIYYVFVHTSYMSVIVISKMTLFQINTFF